MQILFIFNQIKAHVKYLELGKDRLFTFLNRLVMKSFELVSTDVEVLKSWKSTEGQEELVRFDQDALTVEAIS